MSGLQIDLLGGMQIMLDGTPLPGTKVGALVAYLAVTAKPHTRDALAGLLWGELPDGDARANLRQTLATLRKPLERHLLIARDSIALDRQSVMLVDVTEFDRAIRAGRLDEAIAMYRGEFLEGVHVRDAAGFEEWALAERARSRNWYSGTCCVATTRRAPTRRPACWHWIPGGRRCTAS